MKSGRRHSAYPEKPALMLQRILALPLTRSLNRPASPCSDVEAAVMKRGFPA
ncbi:unnamed protein product [Staurois parvus]|uniref:Uncharacterized protein n=1 Tax=Staurois parvus TaxID=386267 RepID=A0ABN9AFX4_9NEOB|nr:unnamed protein product [Staurois parvus]